MDDRHENEDARWKLWEEDPERAARLAYLDVVAHWHDQVVVGQYAGIPCMHRIPRPEQSDPATQRSRPPQYSPDQSASVYEIPGEVLKCWERAA